MLRTDLAMEDLSADLSPSPSSSPVSIMAGAPTPGSIMAGAPTPAGPAGPAGPGVIVDNGRKRKKSDVRGSGAEGSGNRRDRLWRLPVENDSALIEQIRLVGRFGGDWRRAVADRLFDGPKAAISAYRDLEAELELREDDPNLADWYLARQPGLFGPLVAWPGRRLQAAILAQGRAERAASPARLRAGRLRAGARDAEGEPVPPPRWMGTRIEAVASETQARIREVLALDDLRSRDVVGRVRPLPAAFMGALLRVSGGAGEIDRQIRLDRDRRYDLWSEGSGAGGSGGRMVDGSIQDRETQSGGMTGVTPSVPVTMVPVSPAPSSGPSRSGGESRQTDDRSR